MTLALALPAAADSPLARLDARWKLASLGVAAFAVTALQTPSAAGIALAISPGCRGIGYCVDSVSWQLPSGRS